MKSSLSIFLILYFKMIQFDRFYIKLSKIFSEKIMIVNYDE